VDFAGNCNLVDVFLKLIFSAHRKEIIPGLGWSWKAEPWGLLEQDLFYRLDAMSVA